MSASYNAAVHQTVQASDYAVFLITEDFISPNASARDLGASASKTAPRYRISPVPNLTAARMYEKAVGGALVRREPKDCIQDYGKPFQSGLGNLILVTANASSVPYTYIYTDYEAKRGGCTMWPDTFGWVCGHTLAYRTGEAYCESWNRLCADEIGYIDADNWRPFGSKIEYCLSEQIEQQCSVEFSLQLAVVVLLSSLTKAAVLLYVLLFVKADPLLTVGDAIASFLERKDKTTAGMCLMGRDNIGLWQRGRTIPGSVDQIEPRAFRKFRARWHHATTRRGWWTCLVA